VRFLEFLKITSSMSVARISGKVRKIVSRVCLCTMKSQLNFMLVPKFLVLDIILLVNKGLSVLPPKKVFLL